MNKRVEEKRQHERTNEPALVLIEEHQYSVENWSTNGFKIVGFDQDLKTGDCLPIQLQLNLSKGGKEFTNIQITTLIEVIWLSARKDKFGAQFLNLTKLEKDLLKDTIDQIHKGKITLLNQPNQLPEPSFSSSQCSQDSNSSWQRLQSKRVLYTGIYIVIGGVLGYFSLQAVYDSLTNLQIKSAVVAKPTGPVVSPVESVIVKEQGILDEFYVYEGMNVKPGQPLFSIKNDELAERDIDALTREIHSSRVELAEAQANLRKAELLNQQEIEKQQSYQKISQTELDSARAEVAAQTEQHQIAKKDLERFASLVQEGAVSQQAFESTQSRFADVEAKLRKAQSQYTVAQISVESAQKGNFYDGENLISDLPRFTVEVEKQRQLVQIVSQKVRASEQLLNQRVQELQISEPQRQYLLQPSQDKTLFSRNSFSVVYKAPIPGSVVRVTKASGNPVRPRETVMVLQREQVPPTIDAYLTKDQADQISIGKPATVLIPTINEEYQAHITKIDPAISAPNLIGITQTEDLNSKSVYVQLTLNNLSRENNNQLTAASGMPVILSIPKQTNLFNRLAFWLK